MTKIKYYFGLFAKTQYYQAATTIRLSTLPLGFAPVAWWTRFAVTCILYYFKKWKKKAIKSINTHECFNKFRKNLKIIKFLKRKKNSVSNEIIPYRIILNQEIWNNKHLDCMKLFFWKATTARGNKRSVLVWSAKYCSVLADSRNLTIATLQNCCFEKKKLSEFKFKSSKKA